MKFLKAALYAVGRALLIVALIVGGVVALATWALYGPTDGGKTHVQGYTTRDGKHVRPYTRRR